MQIPKSIDPDFLKDTIVEIRYYSDLPYFVFLGAAYKILENIRFGYIAHTAPPGLNQVISTDHHFLKENIRVTLRPDSLLFNFHEEYPKWDLYFKSIKQVVTEIYNECNIQRIVRFGLRYINSFKGTNVFDIIKPSWRVKLGEYETKRSNIKTELIHEGYRVIINVGNDYPMQKDLSLIDIDIIMENAQGINFDGFFQALKRAHEIEKEIMFVHILKNEYLQGKKVKY